jgi:hypothetical protein
MRSEEGDCHRCGIERLISHTNFKRAGTKADMKGKQVADQAI